MYFITGLYKKTTDENIMKKYLLLTALLSMFVSSSFAQWYVYRNSKETPNFIRVYGSFDYGSMKETVNGESISFNPLGITVGGLLSPNLTINTLKRMPLFLETGVEFSYAYGHTTDHLRIDPCEVYSHGQEIKMIGGSNHVELTDEDGNELKVTKYEGMERKINMISASVPVNLAYSIDFSQGKMSLVPFVGANFKFNIVSKVSEGTADGEKVTNRLKDEDVNIFQFGLNAGVNFVIVRGFYAGYRLQYDIMEYAENVKTMKHSLQIGYRFEEIIVT